MGEGLSPISSLPLLVLPFLCAHCWFLPMKDIYDLQKKKVICNRQLQGLLKKKEIATACSNH